MIPESWFSASIILFLTLVIAWTSLKHSPGIGVIVAIITIALVIWQRGDGMQALGFTRPESWTVTILLSLVLGILLALLSSLLVEPLTDRLTGSKHDHSMFDGLRGNFGALLKLLLLVWILVVFLEEVIFRGFLMLELSRLLGTGMVETAVNLLFSSILFGFGHWYQGKSGAMSTGIIGFLLGVIFIAGGYNIWLPILTHGFIDTFGLGLIYINGDRQLKRWVGSNKKTA
jgi:uncharacterized protein